MKTQKTMTKEERKKRQSQTNTQQTVLSTEKSANLFNQYLPYISISTTPILFRLTLLSAPVWRRRRERLAQNELRRLRLVRLSKRCQTSKPPLRGQVLRQVDRQQRLLTTHQINVASIERAPRAAVWEAALQLQHRRTSTLKSIEREPRSSNKNKIKKNESRKESRLGQARQQQRQPPQQKKQETKQKTKK